jgi:large subunit ribosomal protein L31e
MADKPKSPKSPADERLFTVPLRKEWLKTPLNKRAKRSLKTIKSHLSRHMKVPEASVRVSGELNKSIWIRGAGKPPSKIRLKASFDVSSGILHATLPDEKAPEKDKKAKGEEAKKAEAVKEPEKAAAPEGKAHETDSGEKAAEEKLEPKKTEEKG